MLSDRERWIKVCGVTRPADVDVVCEAGADAVGMIFAPSSRQVAIPAAQALSREAAKRALRVGVFRRQDDAQILRVVDAVELDVVQIHDDVTADLATLLHQRGLAVIGAVSVGTTTLAAYDDEPLDAVLVDGPVPGSGHEHAWSGVSARAWRRALIAAGGLRPHNVASVIAAPWVWGVDVATGVESSPGVKDPALVRQFVANARRAFEERA